MCLEGKSTVRQTTAICSTIFLFMEFIHWYHDSSPFVLRFGSPWSPSRRYWSGRLQELDVVLRDEALLPLQLPLQPAGLPRRGHWGIKITGQRSGSSVALKRVRSCVQVWRDPTCKTHHLLGPVWFFLNTFRHFNNHNDMMTTNC